MSGNCIHACLPKYFQQDQRVREKKTKFHQQFLKLTKEKQNTKMQNKNKRKRTNKKNEKKKESHHSENPVWSITKKK